MLHLWRAWSLPPGLPSEFETKEGPEEEAIKNYGRCLHSNRQIVLTTSGTNESIHGYPLTRIELTSTKVSQEKNGISRVTS